MSEFPDMGVVILAAGKGTRMKSQLPKVLHKVQSREMILHVIESVLPLVGNQVYVVVGHQAEQVKTVVSDQYTVEFALQEQLLGTGDAVKAALPFLPDHIKSVLILCGDVPLIRTKTLRSMIRQHEQDRLDITVMTVLLPDPTGYGRVIQDDQGRVSGIVEQADATEAQKSICQVNSGIYLINKDVLSGSLERIDSNNQQQEYYLTDIIGIVHRAGGKIGGVAIQDPREVMGVNTLEQLETANNLMAEMCNELP
ncbi:MAG: nucleoside-diphosphate-sugar pyrophosphorylase [Desulfobacteraceae bacterium]|nr:MAG: nucleoside-diphosphate-sugar pyrophosphorylase [Desulfobacteraceae bacterium]